MIYTQEQYDALLAVCRSYKQEIELLTEMRNKYAETLTQFQIECIKEVIAQKEEAEKRFENNMKSVLENEKKQAVRDFAEKVKERCHNYYPSIDHYCCSEKSVNVKDINELLKEYEE